MSRRFSLPGWQQAGLIARPKLLRRRSGFERATLPPLTIILTPFASLAAVAVASAAGADGVLSGGAKVKK
jgi:hypothetical protein